jgi:agmatine deiminase
MKIATLLLLAAFPFSLLAQTDLPKGMSTEEKELLQSGLYVFPNETAGIATPPPVPVRTMAEWEELQALAVTWVSYKPIMAQLIHHARQECEVVVICADSNAVKVELLNQYALPNLDNISFLHAPFNSVWMRDYGPNPVYANEVDSLYFIDWIYNRPRPNDDLVPDAIGSFFNVPVYTTTQAPSDLVNTGGNFLPDGMGTAFASELILDENRVGNSYGVSAKTEPQIDQIMSDFMGIDRYAKMPVLPYDAIHHIDMHWSLLDEETFLVGEFPAGVSDGPQIEANLQYVLANHMSPFGTPYKVVRIQMPPSATGNFPPNAPYRTYANMVFVNKTLLVPTYYQQYDTTNLRILREALPGYKVVGINCNSMISASGALHCITKQIGVNDPLLIQHQPLRDVADDYEPFEVQARILHRSGVASAQLWYTTDTAQGYSPATMTLTDAANNTWTGQIPAQQSDATIFYYIAATAQNGKTLTRPLPAPAGYWKFDATFTPTTAVADVSPATLTRMDPIFPNPASAITCIPVESAGAADGVIELLDILGRTAQTVYAGRIPQGSSKYFLHADRFEPGVYFVRLRTENHQEVQKLVIR